jgi:hypothetical protein
LPERGPLSNDTTSPGASGSAYGPSGSVRFDSTVSPMDEIGRMVAGSRWTKSKMPCPPGSRPVMKFDHATGLCGGMVVPRR